MVVRRIVASPAMDAAETSFSPLAVRGPRWDSRFTVLILFLPPALVLFTLFVVLPVGEAAWYSAFNWNGFGRPTNWIGFDNYRFVFETRAFWLALRNNGLIIAVSLAIQLPLALTLAFAAPFEVTRQTARSVSSCPKVRWVWVAWAMKSAPIVR